jgi:hypothetical protein
MSEGFSGSVQQIGHIKGSSDADWGAGVGAVAVRRVDRREVEAEVEVLLLEEGKGTVEVCGESV